MRRFRLSVVVFLLGLASPLAPFSGRGPGGAARAQEPEAGRLERLSADLREVAARVSPAVVQIFSTRYAPELGSASAGLELFARQRASGSGVLLDPEGYLVTNAHVVADAERIEVLVAPSAEVLAAFQSSLKPRGELLPAKLVGLDEETDLAVLRIEGSGYPTLTLGDSDRLAPGEIVLAFGSPLGLETSLSMGVVSGTARQLVPEHPMVYIQTDAAINPGNSGGPLVDSRGQVVGLNTFIFSQSGGDEGLGFAAPSNIVAHVYRRIRAEGRVRRGQIGVEVQTVTPALAAGLGLASGRGVLVADVTPGGAADLGGLEEGDLVVTLDGKPMENGRQFTVNLYQRSPGDEVVLEIVRNQATRTLRITVEERADDPLRFADMVKLEQNLVPRLGILALDFTPDLKRRLPPSRREGGVLVASRAAASASGLEPGDVIHALDRREVSSVAGLKSLVEGIPAGKSAVLQIERRGKFRFVLVQLD